jgi:hypothetical protein
MLDNIFKNINNFFVNFLEFLSFRRKNNVILNNDVESCCVLLDGPQSCGILNDDTTTFSE